MEGVIVYAVMAASRSASKAERFSSTAVPWVNRRVS